MEKINYYVVDNELGIQKCLSCGYNLVDGKKLCLACRLLEKKVESVTSIDDPIVIYRENVDRCLGIKKK